MRETRERESIGLGQEGIVCILLCSALLCSGIAWVDGVAVDV